MGYWKLLKHIDYNDDVYRATSSAWLVEPLITVEAALTRSSD